MEAGPGPDTADLGLWEGAAQHGLLHGKLTWEGAEAEIIHRKQPAEKLEGEAQSWPSENAPGWVSQPHQPSGRAGTWETEPMTGAFLGPDNPSSLGTYIPCWAQSKKTSHSPCALSCAKCSRDLRMLLFFTPGQYPLSAPPPQGRCKDWLNGSVRVRDHWEKARLKGVGGGSSHSVQTLTTSCGRHSGPGKSVSL